jgi:hypothetical protein
MDLNNRKLPVLQHHLKYLPAADVQMLNIPQWECPHQATTSPLYLDALQED